MALTLTTPNTVLGALTPSTGAARIATNVVAVLLGSAVLWASAKVQVPFYPVQMTLQTLAIALIAAAYGWKLGLATMLLYLAEGAVGLPVFAGTPERGIGLAYMMGPTAGYLVGFVLSTALVGFVADRGGDKSFFRMLAAMLAGGAIVLGLGFAYLATIIGVEKAWIGGVVPFLLGDALKITIAALVVVGAQHVLGKRV
jgi:biotin transport system substrate-specific component